MSLLWLLFLLPSSLFAQDRQVLYQHQFTSEWWASQPIGVVAYTMCGEQPEDTVFTVFRPGSEREYYYNAVVVHEAVHREQAKRFENCHQSLDYYRSSIEHRADQEAEAYAASLHWLVDHGQDEIEWRSKFLFILFNICEGKINIGTLNGLITKYYAVAPTSN